MIIHFIHFCILNHFGTVLCNHMMSSLNKCRNKTADLCNVIWKQWFIALTNTTNMCQALEYCKTGWLICSVSLLHSGHDGGGGQRQEEPWRVRHGSGPGSRWLCLPGWVCVWRLGSHRWRQTGTVLNAATFTHHHTLKKLHNSQQDPLDFNCL